MELLKREILFGFLKNGDLNIAGRKGFLIHDEWNHLDTKDFDVKLCEDYYLEVTNGHEIVRRR